MQPSSSNIDLIVLGTGVSGLTTALTLQLMGYNTQLIGDKLVNEKSSEGKEDSLFASRYPAASIIPHSVHSKRQKILFKDSQEIFRSLYGDDHPWIRKNTHYEWFQYPVKEPVYSEWMEDFTMLNHDSTDPLTRKVFDSTDYRDIYGWSFSCYFVDWPLYAAKLIEWYKASGGTYQKRHITPQEIRNSDIPYIVNCTGARTHELFDDEEDFCFLLGKSIIVEDGPTTRELSNITTYNFTPGAEIYSHSSGCPVDLYCYPRDTGWVLGGSRLHGHIDKKGRWKGEEWTGRMLSVDKQQVPAPIYEINRQIIRRLYDVDIKNYTLKAKSGYRFMRDSKTEGLRLEEDQQLGKTVFHNYGHGGAGVTLSWGCALQIARFVRNYVTPGRSTPTEDTPSLETLREKITSVY